MPGLFLNHVKLAEESGGNITLDGNVQFPAGHVIQTVYAETSATLTITNTTRDKNIRSIRSYGFHAENCNDSTKTLSLIHI